MKDLAASVKRTIGESKSLLVAETRSIIDKRKIVHATTGSHTPVPLQKHCCAGVSLIQQHRAPSVPVVRCETRHWSPLVVPRLVVLVMEMVVRNKMSQVLQGEDHDQPPSGAIMRERLHRISALP
jgi:hypothetical protein